MFISFAGKPASRQTAMWALQPLLFCLGVVEGTLAADTPMASCAFELGTDCDGQDLQHINGSLATMTQGRCCSLCGSSDACAVAVLIAGFPVAGQSTCILKSGCAKPGPQGGRLKICMPQGGSSGNLSCTPPPPTPPPPQPPPSPPLSVAIDLTKSEPLPHYWERCVGSGHGALTLREDWRLQVVMAREDIGFQRVRFHGAVHCCVSLSPGRRPSSVASVHLQLGWCLGVRFFGGGWGMEARRHEARRHGCVGLNAPRLCSLLSALCSLLSALCSLRSLVLAPALSRARALSLSLSVCAGTLFHTGILDDDMSVSFSANETGFVNVDSTCDFLVDNNMSMVMELGFMPRWLARGKDGFYCTHTINHYIGCSDPPSDFNLWGDLIYKLGKHLVERYGENAMSTNWEFEVRESLLGARAARGNGLCLLHGLHGHLVFHARTSTRALFSCRSLALSFSLSRALSLFRSRLFCLLVHLAAWPYVPIYQCLPIITVSLPPPPPAASCVCVYLPGMRAGVLPNILCSLPAVPAVPGDT